VHGGGGEALTERGEMEGEKDKGKKEEPLDPIMMDDDQIKQITAKTGKTRSRVPYQYKVNTKKRVVATREGLASGEEEVEDLRVMGNIKEILHAPYERKMRGLIQVDIGGHPPFPTGSKQFSGNFGNLLFLAGFNFQGHFEGLNEGFLRSRFSMIAKGMIEPPK
jgi:hypothetical protein